MNSNGRKRGIEVLPHDKGTFLVQSRTDRQDYHLVDLTENSCTCSGFQFRKECFHIRYLCKLLGVETPKPNNQPIAA
jgi:hypothetical protein